MGIADTFKKIWEWEPGKKQTVPVPAYVPVTVPVIKQPSTPATKLGGIKVSKFKGLSTTRRIGENTPYPPDILYPPSPLDVWRDEDLSAETFDRISPSAVLDLFADISPDVSRALWDFLLFCNPGFEIVCYRPGTDSPDPRAQKVLDQFIGVLKERHGSLDIMFSRLFIGAFLRGAFFAELVLDRTGRIPLNIRVPNPDIVRFRKRQDNELGTVYDLGYLDRETGKFVSLERPTIKYLPVHPFPDSPYGRPIATAAVFSTVFLIGMLHDIRRVIAQQGYPRIDVVVHLEELAKIMPQDSATDPDAFQAWVNKIVDEVKTAYATLEPDDIYIHTDIVEVKRPIGTVDATAIGAVDNIIEMLERFTMRALKSMPLLMGVVEGMSEANANRQWEIHVAGIKIMQHSCETMIGTLLTLALQAQGVVSSVKVTFAELRTAERLRDEMVDQLLITNTAAKYILGYIDQDEASMLVTGHMPVLDEPMGWPKNYVPSGPGNEVEAAGAGADASNTDNADDKGPVGDDRNYADVFNRVDSWIFPLGKPVVAPELIKLNGQK